MAELERVSKIPKLFTVTGIIWLFIGGILGILMIINQYLGGSTTSYYSYLTGHGVIMAFSGLFQLMVGLSLLRAGFCYGKPVEGILPISSYIVLNIGAILFAGASLSGVRISYTLMYPLPVYGASIGLWNLDGLRAAIIGVALLLIGMVILYPLALAKVMFFGKSIEELQIEKRRFRGILDPAMLGMAAYIFLLPPLGMPILLTALSFIPVLYGYMPLQPILFVADPVNFNYLLWLFAHNLMEAMGIMALSTLYFIAPIYTGDRSFQLYSWNLGILAVLFYTSAAITAFFHHLYTMVSIQPLGLSFLAQIASWLTGFGAAFTLFNILATGWRHGYIPHTPIIAGLTGLLLYISDGFIALELGTIGWNLRLHGTLYVTGHTMAILIAVLILWLGEYYHYHPIIFNRLIPRRLGNTHILLTGIGGFGIMYSLAYMGMKGIPRRIFPWTSQYLIDAAPLVIAVAVFAAAQIIYIISYLKARRIEHVAQAS